MQAREKRHLQKNNNILFLLEEIFNDQQKSHEQFHPLTFDCVGFLMTAEMRQILEGATV